MIKGIYEKSTPPIILKNDRVNNFPLRCTKARMSAPTTFTQPGTGESS